jgi:hypothetical protein
MKNVSKFDSLKKPLYLAAIAKVAWNKTQDRQLQRRSGFTCAVHADYAPSLGLKELNEV